MKNAFSFILKALFILKIFKFLSWLFGHDEKRLDKKDKINFKIYDITTYISRNKINEIMKFGQLMEYNITNILVEKSSIKCGEVTIPRPFPKN